MTLSIVIILNIMFFYMITNIFLVCPTAVQVLLDCTNFELLCTSWGPHLAAAITLQQNGVLLGFLECVQNIFICMHETP
jgi:hypothetical protein